MPLVVREYMHYVPVYALWKLYKNERISRKAALDKIQERYSLLKYFAYYPLYKSYKFIGRIIKSIIAMIQTLMSSRQERGELPRTVCAPIEGLQREQDYYEYTRTEILELLPDSPSKSSGNRLRRREHTGLVKKTEALLMGWGVKCQRRPPCSLARNWMPSIP